MALQVKLVRGRWIQKENRVWTHVPDVESIHCSVSLPENVTFKDVVSVIRRKLGVKEVDDIYISYQWPRWMLGEEWGKVDPIYLNTDEDTSLFMAIRADLDEVYLRVRVIAAPLESVLRTNTIGRYGMKDVPEQPAGGLVGLLMQGVGSDSRNVGETIITAAGQGMCQPGIATQVGEQVGESSSYTGRVCRPEKGKDKEICYDAGTTVPLSTQLADLQRYFQPLPRGPVYASLAEDIVNTATPIAGEGAPQPRQASLNLNLGCTAVADADEAYQSPRQPPIYSLGSSFSSSDFMINESDTGSSRRQRTTLFGARSRAPIVYPPQAELSYVGQQPTLRQDLTTRKGKEILIDDTGPPKDFFSPAHRIRGASTSRFPRTFQDVGPSSVFPTQPPTIEVCPLPGRQVYDTRITPSIHPRDAPPYFDDPEGEDELSEALVDVDYEGDEIFIGRIFRTIEDCRMKLSIHAINRKFHFRYAKSCAAKIIAVCVGDGCPWRVYAPRMEDNRRYEVRCATLQHTCSVDARGSFHKQASTAVIGDMMRARYSAGSTGPRAFELRRLLRQEFSLHVSYWKAWRAREIAMDTALGSAMGSYALIPPYFDLLMQTNPDSVVGLQTETSLEGVERFKYLFLSLAASAQGYQYMRKVVIIDGTHLCGRYGGCLVSASAQDGNYQIFPLAFGIVNSENDEAWEWFLNKLTAVVPDEPDLVFVSDRHASIYAGLRKVYPMSSHAACIVHLQRNIQSRFKKSQLGRLVSQAARAYTMYEFENLFGKIMEEDSQCAAYLIDIGFQHWTRSHFVGDRYNVMTSNVSEALNKVLSMVREYPVISILETIRTTLVSWFALRRDAAQRNDDILTPKVQEMIIDNYEKSTSYAVQKIADGIYEVKDELGQSFAVHLWEESCSCREFQLLYIPCRHAVAAAIREGVRVETLVGVHYTSEYRRLAYEGVIMPVPDINGLKPSAEHVGGGSLRPPSVRRPPGRPRKKRIPSRGEFKRVSHRKCTRCRGGGHNRSTCKEPLTGP